MPAPALMGSSTESVDGEYTEPNYSFSRRSTANTADHEFRLLWEDDKERKKLKEESPCQYEQLELWFGADKEQLKKEYVDIINESSPRRTYLHEAAEIALYLFKEGRPARIWTVGGRGAGQAGFHPAIKSIHGGCIYTYDQADVLILTADEHDLYEQFRSKRNTPPKLVIVRDEAHQRRRLAETLEEWLRKHEQPSVIRDPQVDVQLLGKVMGENDQIGGAVTSMPLSEAVTRWNARKSGVISPRNAPLNLLNVSAGLNRPYNGAVYGIHKRMSLLNDAITMIDLEEYSRLTVGSAPQKVPCDIKGCLRWRILAQRGAVSGWHIDQCGVFTWVHLEGNKEDESAESPHDVVKLWAVFPMEQLPADAQRQALDGFAAMGAAWSPTVEGGIPVLALCRGDQYIQAPFTIHAPITLTDCKFEGGMAWSKTDLLRTLRSWRFTVDHDVCTNEDLPKQTQGVMHHFRNLILNWPSESNVLTKKLNQEAVEIIQHLHGRVAQCDCISPCKQESCPCAHARAECGIYCHNGTACRCFWSERSIPLGNEGD